MSLNPNVRTEVVEVLLNPSELEALDKIRSAFGMARSTFLRGLSNNAARTHGMAPPPFRESRGCRGPGKVAGRPRSMAFTGRRNL